MIQFSCACGRRLEGREEDVGKPASCPLCGAAMAIPSAQVAQMRDKLPRRADGVRLDAIRTDCSDERSREVEPDEDHLPLPRRDRTVRPISGQTKVRLILAALLVGGCFLFVCNDIISVRMLVGGRVRTPSMRSMERNNLIQLANAMHGFNDTYNAFPQAAAFRSPDGKPLLSWRVALLPYIEQVDLYVRFRLDEPWDSPNNIKLLPMMPRTYLQPGQALDGSGLTHYQVLVGPGTIFEAPLKDGGKVGGRNLPLFLGRNAPLPGMHFDDITDGTSNTILIVAADAAVPWSKPEDLSYDPEGPLPVFSKRFPGFFEVALADGSIKSIAQGISEATLRNAITRNDGQPLGRDW